MYTLLCFAACMCYCGCADVNSAACLSRVRRAHDMIQCVTACSRCPYCLCVAGPSIKTIDSAGSFYTVYPERVTWSEAAATCRRLPGGRLAILDSQGLIDKISQDLLATLPFQTAVRSAWVGATGNNTAFNPNALNVTDLVHEAQSGNGSLKAQLPPQEQPSQLSELTLKWTGGTPVAQPLLRRPDSLDQLWTVHDVVWSQQYVPDNARDVCGRVMIQVPSSKGVVNPASVSPGVWYYDCKKPAAFICQSKHNIMALVFVHNASILIQS